MNQEVKYLEAGHSASQSLAVAALKNESATQSLAVAALKNESATQSLVVAALKNESTTQSLDVATLKNESAAQSLDVAELKKEFREQNAQLKNSYDILQKKLNYIENKNNVLKNDYAALRSQITDWQNMSIHTKQELDFFTHSIAASNIQNVTTIQSGMDTLISQVQSLNSQLNFLSRLQPLGVRTFWR
ncbi:unnamed protein product [Mytilus coruscus]|uniref:Uncharacterized protein n=1 Tax=Mytilus coruscus TaxID=42192 RepID=A0A6J8F2U4_MYTCO|nr:unnamed protein product [Mytilus coruscus]